MARPLPVHYHSGKVRDSEKALRPENFHTYALEDILAFHLVWSLLTPKSLRFINSYASESFDRTTLKDEFSDNLVNNVAKNCSSTIVVIHNAGKSAKLP